ncbi:GNAT family N-acetyltransferase [Halocalculus aciditolerans]|uniref:GNAT family N-acetyltransferase n=1 Tax=Halocalculus aciditolerans TaxID=1383812 RepID=A0A830F9K0_9EURY|nr:GNAT family N-acetyltransferase [Halocalculus aciditolerans]GGL53445.1 GNAT family N-acetyltransferase [Halocalculus aciditolerans]
MTDEAGRDLRVRSFRGLCRVDEAELAAMYAAFDPTMRAQGLPPMDRERIHAWLDQIAPGLHAVIEHDGGVVGHAVLVPTESAAAELAIFVHQDYQGAGVGTHLLRTLLDAGAADGIPAVVLHVERTNPRAIALYKSCGFSVADDRMERMELRMRRSLVPGEPDE